MWGSIFKWIISFTPLFYYILTNGKSLMIQFHDPFLVWFDITYNYNREILCEASFQFFSQFFDSSHQFLLELEEAWVHNFHISQSLFSFSILCFSLVVVSSMPHDQFLPFLEGGSEEYQDSVHEYCNNITQLNRH